MSVGSSYLSWNRRVAERYVASRAAHKVRWHFLDAAAGAAGAAMLWVTIGRLAAIVFALVWAVLMLFGLLSLSGIELVLWLLGQCVDAFVLPLFSKNARRVVAESARVQELGRDRNVVGLIHMLDSDVRGRSDYSIVRGNAARTLGQMGDPRAIPYLMEMHDDPEEHVRAWVWSALGTLKAQEAVNFLVDGLKDPSELLRHTAAEALGHIGAADAIPALREALETDPDPYMRLTAVEALVILGDNSARDRVPDVLSAIDARTRERPRLKRLREAVETGEVLTPWVYPWDRPRR